MAAHDERQGQFIELYTLYEDSKLSECIQQGRRMLRDFTMPPLYRMKTLWVLRGAEIDPHNAEVSRGILNKPGTKNVLT